MKKLALLAIGQTYQISVTRRKLAALAEYFDVTCATSMLRKETLFGRSIFDFDEPFPGESISVVRLAEWPASMNFTKFIYRNLGPLFRQERFDIVLVDAEPWAFYKWQAWWLTRRYQPSALFGEFTWENIERPGLRGWILSWIYRVTVRTDDFIISGNQASRMILLKYGGFKERNLVAAQHGVDTEDFCPVLSERKKHFRKGFNLPLNAFLVGFCGRLVVEKGVLDLISAVGEVRIEPAHQNVHLVLVGDGPLRSKIIGSCPAWLHLLPGQPSSAIPQFMKSIDLFVLPSKPFRKGGRVWEEQFGHVLIEAMSCGVPTLGSNSGAIPEVIGMPDAVFQHSDVKALVLALVKAIEDPDWCAALGKKQRKRIEENYSHQAVARKYANFFSAIHKLKQQNR